MPRLFVAVDPPDSVVEEIAALREAGPQPGREEHTLDARWTDPAQYHLTLRFVGEVEEYRVDAIQDAVAPDRDESPGPFELRPSGLGVFPSRRNPRILWVGFENAPGLLSLRKGLEERLVESGLDPDDRSFVPHLTVARLDGTPAGEVHRFVKAHRDFSTRSFRVDAYHLYESELRSSGARHRRLETYSLES